MILYLIIYIFKFFFQNSKLVLKLTQNNDFLMIFLISFHNSTRIKFIEENWGKTFIEHYGKSNLIVLSSLGCPNTTLICLEYPEEYFDIVNSSTHYQDHFDRAAKRAFAVDYFLKKNSFKWLLILTDDVIVNMPKLQNYIEEIEIEHGNPFNKSIIQGNCIYNGINRLYLQGGSGYIMSYKSALEFSKFSKKWVNDTYIADDVYFSDVINKLGLTLKNCTSNKFLGHQFSKYNQNVIKLKDFKRIPFCPILKENNFCKSFLSPLNEKIFLHQGTNPIETNSFANIIFNKSFSNIYWYQDRKIPRICKKKNDY